jgi:hypothetical protein
MSPADILPPSTPSSPIAVPDHIVQAVNKGECILFLGAMVSASSPPNSRFHYDQGPPGGGELSKRLAKKCDYPSNDTWNLARVSLYFETGKDRSRNLLVKTIAEEIGSDCLVPSPALRMLAALPFTTIITTNYDHLFEEALHLTKLPTGARKDPIVKVYDPHRTGSVEDVPVRPTPAKPILLKLHGDIDRPESIVVTEEDYITFIQQMADDKLHPIHKKIRMNMTEWPTLFIGYSLKDYNLRLLFRTLRWNVDSANFPLSFSVDPRPDNLIVSVWQYGDKKIVSFIEQDVWTFVPSLYKQCTGTEYQPND